MMGVQPQKGVSTTSSLPPRQTTSTICATNKSKGTSIVDPKEIDAQKRIEKEVKLEFLKNRLKAAQMMREKIRATNIQIQASGCVAPSRKEWNRNVASLENLKRKLGEQWNL